MPSPAPPRTARAGSPVDARPRAPLTAEETRLREVSLGLSVTFYGMANHATQNIPARPDSVLRTAEEFLHWLQGYEIGSLGR